MPLRTVTWYLKRALLNEQDHYTSVSGILTGAGQTPAVAGDIDFSYPAGSFDTQASILKLAKQLEDLSVGAYLGALAALADARDHGWARADRRLRGPALGLLHGGARRQDVQELVPECAHHRPGLGRA